MSPYGFKTAQEHYEALLAETRKRGGPDVYTMKDFPAEEWNGLYESPRVVARNLQTWYWGTAQPDPDHSVDTDAGVSAANGARGLSPGAGQRCLAGDVLLARGLHAPLVPLQHFGAPRSSPRRISCRS